MKLYLTQILKEANAMGFGAPGQGGNSGDVAMAATAPGPQMPNAGATPALQANPQAGGMMLPGSGMGMGQSIIGNGPGQIQLGTQPFKTVI